MEGSVIDRFLQATEANPDQTAIVVPPTGQTISYAELYRRANIIVTFLRSHLNAIGSVVAFSCTDNSDLVPTCLLGIFSAGHIYLPINTSTPPERLRFILEDSGCKIVLCDYAPPEELIEISELLGIKVVEVRALFREIASYDAIADASQTGGKGGSAYIIYTSGTTGVPKGCLLTHENLASLFWSIDKVPFDFSYEDVWVLCHSHCFDFSIWEMLGALCYGGKLVIPSRATVKDPRLLWSCLINESVSVLNQTPEAFYNLAQVAINNKNQSDLTALRYVIMGGDRLNPSRLRGWFEAYGYHQVRVINMFGISETTIHSTFRELTPSDVQDGLSNIGKPLPGTEFEVVEQSTLTHVGVGEIGELLITGPGVCSGYIHQDRLNREKFQRLPKKKMRYRTGDLVYQLKDGNYVYVGRVDDQVKIRGYRIEPAEIERQISSVLDTQNVVVLPDQNKLNLCAFISGKEFDRNELRKALLENLPEYMIPSRFVSLQEIPITENGKIDKKALSALIDGPIAGTSKKTLDEKECALLDACEKIFPLKGQYSIDSDFFEIGGNSIDVVRLVCQLEKIGYLIGVEDILRLQRLQKIAKSLSPLKTRTVSAHYSNSVFPVTYHQRKYVNSFIKNPELTFGNLVFPILFSVPLDRARFRDAVYRVMRNHAMLRSQLLNSGDWFEVLSEVRGNEIVRESFIGRSLSNRDALRVFGKRYLKDIIDIRNSPPFKVVVARMCKADFLGVFVFNHVAVDNRSVVLFTEQIENAYVSGELNQSSRNEEYAFVRYAHEQVDLLKKKSAAKDFWTEKYARSREGEGLSRRPATWEPSVAYQERVKLEPSHAQAIREWCLKHRLTAASWFLAAYVRFLQEVLKRNHLVIGATISTRRGADEINAIGSFLNQALFCYQTAVFQPFEILCQRVSEEMAEFQRFVRFPIGFFQDQIPVGSPALFDYLFNFFEREDWSGERIIIPPDGKKLRFISENTMMRTFTLSIFETDTFECELRYRADEIKKGLSGVFSQAWMKTIETIILELA